MQTDSIVWGETYDISVTVKDSAGDAITLDGDYTVACRVAHTLGGASFVDPTMTIAGGVATTSIDTGDPPWKPGVYYYDVRVTDDGGHDYWSEPVELTLTDRNTPNT